MILWPAAQLTASLLVAVACTLASTPALSAQKNERAAVQTRLPSPETIVNAYLKAVGGKKRVATIRDATYEWTAFRKNQTEPQVSVRIRTKAPASTRIDRTTKDGETSVGANPRTAWERSSQNILRTLTDAEAKATKLEATLTASRLANLKKQNILARTVALEEKRGEASGETTSEPAYVVEFTTREGARLRYWFGASSKLLLKTTDDTRRITVRFGEYKTVNGLLEPHRIEVGEPEALTLQLQNVRYNTNISDAVFNPPSAESLDITALLHELRGNQKTLDERARQYTCIQKQTEREINDRGEIKKEKVKISEVYPLPGRRPVFKLISEDGVPLSSERAEREAKRAGEELAEAERDIEKKQKREREQGAKENGGSIFEEDEDARSIVEALLRASDFVAPRRERFRDRDAVVFDFLPRADFRPRNRLDSVVAKLNGIAWIDVADKQLMRFEARLTKGYKIGGGLLVSVRPGATLVIDQTRLPDGLWMPHRAQFNASVKFLLVAGVTANVALEWSDYRRFNTETGDVKLEQPKAQP
ncbi:MAG: hypothetical protein H0T92_21570 [Pyrinomonadaceae bacterium]|nr:hypothetical protein [Pyrinomonadaceae bacterium]